MGFEQLFAAFASGSPTVLHPTINNYTPVKPPSKKYLYNSAAMVRKRKDYGEAPDPQDGPPKKTKLLPEGDTSENPELKRLEEYWGDCTTKYFQNLPAELVDGICQHVSAHLAYLPE